MQQLDAVGWLWFSVPVMGSVSAYRSFASLLRGSKPFGKVVLIEICASPCLVNVVCFLGQMFYAWRIWILGHRTWITGVIFSVSCVCDFLFMAFHYSTLLVIRLVTLSGFSCSLDLLHFLHELVLADANAADKFSTDHAPATDWRCATRFRRVRRCQGRDHWRFFKT